MLARNTWYCRHSRPGRRALALAEVAGGERRHAGRRGADHHQEEGRRGVEPQVERQLRQAERQHRHLAACANSAAQRHAEQHQAERAAERETAPWRHQLEAAQREHAGHADQQPGRRRRTSTQSSSSQRGEVGLRAQCVRRRAAVGLGCLGLGARAWAWRVRAARRFGRGAALGCRWARTHAVLRQVVADQLAHHLRGRQVLLGAQALEGGLLGRIDQQRQPCGLQLHGAWHVNAMCIRRHESHARMPSCGRPDAGSAVAHRAGAALQRCAAWSGAPSPALQQRPAEQPLQRPPAARWPGVCRRSASR